MPPFGWHPSVETRARMAAAKRGRPGNHCIPHTPEAKAKDSASMMGNQSIRRASVKGECVYCGLPGETHDHVVPRKRGGTDDPSNVVVACFTCNRSKRNRTPAEWLEHGLYQGYARPGGAQ